MPLSDLADYGDREIVPEAGSEDVIVIASVGAFEYIMIHDVLILVAILFGGFLYYLWSSSKNNFMKQYAFVIKIFLLIVSFILAFVNKDYLVMGNFVFGGRSSVMMLILIEIIDAIIDKKRKIRI